MRVELKERKILEILKNHFGQFHKLNNDNSRLHTTSCGLSNLWTISFSVTMFMNTTFLYCKYAILNLSNSYILPSLKYFSSANYYILAILFLS